MSQQPPHTPCSPHDPGGYPNPYAQQAQQRSHTTRNVLLAVGAAVLLFCGGIVAFVTWVVVQVGEGLDPDYEGSRDDPLFVAEGQAFSIRGLDYEAGWRITSSGDEVAVDGLRVTNDRADSDDASSLLTVELYRDDVRLALLDCTGGINLAAGRSALLTCSTNGGDVAGHDEIQVFDSSGFG